MSEQNTGQYIHGFYFPNLRRLADVIMKVLDISVPVAIMPLRMKTSNAAGYAEKKSDGYTIFIDTDVLRKDEPTDIAINLFIHELWHVKQMETGRLDINSADTVAKWEGTHYTIAAINHDNRPWEIEAKSMESVYLEHVKSRL